MVNNCKKAFLNENLIKNVYTIQLDDFIFDRHDGKTYKLQKSIYKLKQVSRSWNIHFGEVIIEFGFIKNKHESCVKKGQLEYSDQEGQLYVDTKARKIDRFSFWCCWTL